MAGRSRRCFRGLRAWWRRQRSSLREWWLGLGRKPAFVLWSGPLGSLDPRMARVEAPRRPSSDSSNRIEGEPRAAPSGSDDRPGREPVGFFLMPYRLRHYFWAGGALASGALMVHGPTSNGPVQPGCSFCDGPSGSGYFDPPTVILAFGALLALWYGGPWWVYVWQRLPVLSELYLRLPKRLRPWMRVGVPSGGGRYHNHPAWFLLGWMTPFGRWLHRRIAARSAPPERLAVAFRGPDSRQGRLTRIATAELMSGRPASSDLAPIARWLFYCLAPLWQFLIVMSLVMLIAATGPGRDWIDKADLLRLDMAWVLLSWYFFIREMRLMPADLTVTTADLAALPLQIPRPESRLPAVIDDRMFRLALNAAVTIIAVVYATLAALL